MIWDQAVHWSTVIPAKAGIPFLASAFPKAWKLDSGLRGNDGIPGARNSEMTPLLVPGHPPCASGRHLSAPGQKGAETIGLRGTVGSAGRRVCGLRPLVAKEETRTPIRRGGRATS